MWLAVSFFVISIVDIVLVSTPINLKNFQVILKLGELRLVIESNKISKGETSRIQIRDIND